MLMRISKPSASESVDTNSQQLTQIHPSIPQMLIGWDSEMINAEEAGLWHKVGKGPTGLVERPNIVTDYLGLDAGNISKYGSSDISNSSLLIQTWLCRAMSS